MRLSSLANCGWFGLGRVRYSRGQFVLFRVVFGAYLAWHCLTLIPWGPELFGRAGLIPEPSLQGAFALFPNLLTWMDSPLGTRLFLAVLALAAVGFAAGWRRPWLALLLWYGWACLFNRNIFIGNPGLPIVGWLLLACVLVPDERGPAAWAMPRAIHGGAWLIMALGYTLSGVHKLGSPSWLDGTAILRLLENPLARDVPWREWLLHGPALIPRAMAYGSLALELSFLPLALLPRVRPWLWLAMTGMHLGILTLVGFADLTLGVLMMHLFLVDGAWLRPQGERPRELVLCFDGVCGLCNGVVTFLLQEDLEQRIRFTPLQGQFAAERLTPAQTTSLASLCVVKDGAVLEKSDAVLELCGQLGGVWRLATVLRRVPKPLRDRAYAFVARHRYSWFGRKEACRIPTPEERSRFIP